MARPPIIRPFFNVAPLRPGYIWDPVKDMRARAEAPPPTPGTALWHYDSPERRFEQIRDDA
ncbi:hypothetical protein GGQ20_002121 [Salinibacter ruber]|nr:hypothetical protein [Salinibacter ruber]